MSDLLSTAQQYTKLVKKSSTHGGEWKGPCPFCGGKDRFSVQPNEWDEGRWLCTCTGRTWKPAKAFYEKIGIDASNWPVAPARSVPAPKKEYRWRANPGYYLDEYESHPSRFEIWQKYKKLTKETIEHAHFGIGVLPEYSSKCRGERLIVPILDGTMLIGFRARWMGCRCCDRVSDKWVVTAGAVLDLLPLYGAEDLQPGKVVWLVENCVDARLITQNTPFIGLATYSTGYWRQGWAETLVHYNPDLVVVAYDNDLVGNGGAWRRDEFIAEWNKSHPNNPAPESKGIRLVNYLNKTGVRAILYDWRDAEYKTDVGSIL